MTRLIAALLAVVAGGLFVGTRSALPLAQDKAVETEASPTLFRWRTAPLRAQAGDEPLRFFVPSGPAGHKRLFVTTHGLLQLDTTNGATTLIKRDADGRLTRTSIAAPAQPGGVTDIFYANLHTFGSGVVGNFEIASGDFGTLLHDTRNGNLWQLEERDNGSLVWASTDPDHPRPGQAYLGVGVEAGDGGVKITSVAADSPAALVGLKVGDVIQKAGDKELKAGEDLGAALKDKKPGDAVRLTIQRTQGSNTTTFTIEVTLGEYK